MIRIRLGPRQMHRLSEHKAVKFRTPKGEIEVILSEDIQMIWVDPTEVSEAVASFMDVPKSEQN